jgi:hypothetical protein
LAVTHGAIDQCRATAAVGHVKMSAMLIEYRDGETEIRVISDFVEPTLAEALALVADGATNRQNLLEQAWLPPADVLAELERLDGQA